MITKASENKNPLPGHSNSICKERCNIFFFQPKLIINQPNDIYEQEADAVAERVMRMPANETRSAFFQAKPLPISLVQKKCACEEEEKKVQMKGNPGADAGISATPAVYDAVNSMGQSMDNSTRNFMESRFGYDFKNVQIHNDSLAHKSSADINALAYTHGNHVVFGAGQYQPTTNPGKKLLAHELAHVVQQKDSEGIRRKNKPKFDKATFHRENCVGVVIDPSKARCEFEGKEAIVIRLAKEYAIRKCGRAILALSVLKAEELGRLAKLIFHVEKPPSRDLSKTIIENVRTKLETTPIICKTCFDENCNKGGIFAYTPDSHISISICPLFFNDDKLTETPRFIIHEGCHLADVDIDNFLSKRRSEGYCKTEDGKFNYWDNPCPEDNDNLTNADAWSFFIDRLSITV